MLGSLLRTRGAVSSVPVRVVQRCQPSGTTTGSSTSILRTASRPSRSFSTDKAAATATATAAASSSTLSLYTWGTNVNGSLLQSTTEKIVWEPTKVDLGEAVVGVTCGSTDTAVILENGDVIVAGTNKSGQLGLGHTNPVAEWTKIPDLPPAEKVAFGQGNTAVVTRDGDLYTFGFGGSLVAGMGCLGQGDGKSYLEPQLVESLVEDGCYAKDATMGESHMTVLTREGEVLTTGSSSYGRLGNGETSVDQLFLEPVEILRTADQIAGGKSFTLALAEGVIYGWGRNHKGQLGTGFGMAVDMYSMEQVPYLLDADELLNRTVTKVAAGNNHAACITENGELFTWGSSLFLEPVRVPEVLHTKIIDIECGNDYTMALSEDHQIYVWGAGKTGVLGLGSNTKNLNQAQLIHGLTDHRVVSMSAGWAHAACLVED
jgi:alpha-tubulin suppressor-like RCC1 family protein